MNRVAVLTVSSRVPDPVKEPYYKLQAFQASCKRRNIEPIYLQGQWRGLMSKPRWLLAWLEKNGQDYDHIIVTDAWDVLMVATVEEMIGKFNNQKFPILFNAERSCFPKPELAERFPSSPTPYRFLNSGFIVSKTDAAIQMLRDMRLETLPDDVLPDGKVVNTNDQEHYQLWFLDHQDKADLDREAMICQSLHDAGATEFYIDPTAVRITSRVTGNMPCAFHGNGSGKEWLSKIIRWMQL